MTERLQRIHAYLRAGNVPCEISTRPGLGVVLQAGTPDTGTWDVVLRDTGRELWIHDSRGAVRLLDDPSDAGAGDAVKLEVVQAWADQGNPDARALIAQLQRASRAQPGSGATGRAGYFDPSDAVSPFLDPWHLAERMFDAASRIGSMFLTPPPGSAALTVWSPWGTVQIGYFRR